MKENSSKTQLTNRIYKFLFSDMTLKATTRRIEQRGEDYDDDDDDDEEERGKRAKLLESV